MKCQKSVLPFCVSAQSFDHQDMVEFVVVYGGDYFLEFGHAPPAEGLVEVKNAYLAVVTLSRNCLKYEKSLNRSILTSSGNQISNKVEHYPSHWVHLHRFFSRHLS